MPIVDRNVHTNTNGYREVSLEYRIARAVELDSRQVSERTNRIACPMLDACRNSATYGEQVLAATDKKHLTAWAEAVGNSPIGIRTIGYASGPWYKIVLNALRGRFDDQELNTGFVRSLKHGIRTGILGDGSFSQNELNELVWSFLPELKGQAIKCSWVYSDDSANYYLTEPMLSSLMSHNETNADRGKFGRGLGRILSSFEMESLLLGPLAQKVLQDPKSGSDSLQAISVRDLHDFYKYGLLPLPVEERLEKAELLDIPQLSSKPESHKVDSPCKASRSERTTF